jgi:hypothetical protein
MTLEHAHSFLVHPSKAEQEQPGIGGTSVPPGGALGKMLGRVFDKASEECDIDIVFRHDDAGNQQNDTRDLLVAYVGSPTIPNGRKIAARLQTVTTNRSGLGLLFLMQGKVGGVYRLVVSRFPADQGVIAEEDRERLSVEFIERVFMKNARAYKSAIYESDSLARGFWDGRAVDRQISGPKELSDYWITDFLSSNLRTTGPAGTKRIAAALRESIKRAPSLEAKQELVAAASLLRGQHGRSVSGTKLVERLGLSDEAGSALQDALPRPELMGEVFRFDREEFEKHVMYRLVELDNGGVLIADDADSERVRFTTEGAVVDSRLRKSK